MSEVNVEEVVDQIKAKLASSGIMAEKPALPQVPEEAKKDFKLLLMEANNLALQSQLIQHRNTQIVAELIALNNKVLGGLNLNTEEFGVNLNDLTIVKK